jgi:hypothetical protein
VNAVMNFRVQYNARNFLAENLLASQEGLCSMKLVFYHRNFSNKMEAHIRKMEAHTQNLTEFLY